MEMNNRVYIANRISSHGQACRAVVWELELSLRLSPCTSRSDTRVCVCSAMFIEERGKDRDSDTGVSLTVSSM